MIELRNVTKEYDNSTPLKDVSVTVNEGDIIAVIGPSGTGKSTLLRCINMLTPPTSGQIFIDEEEITAKGADVERLRRKCGMVFQQFNLFGHLTVLENVCEPQIHILKRTPQEACDIAMKYLRKVGMAKQIYNYPDSLSGGQMQRVAIARTLACDPRIILFDEPTSALDPTMVGEVEYIIRQLAEEGRTMMIVTHEMEFAKNVANRVFYMDQGGICEEGSVEDIFEHPKKERTRRFIRQIRFLQLTMEAGNTDFVSIISDLQRFCEKNLISRRMANRIGLFLEEFLYNIVLPEMQPGRVLSIELESAKAGENANITVTDNGAGIFTKDVIDKMDNISRDIVMHSVKSFSMKEDGITAVF